MKYTQLKETAAKEMQLNAGILLDNFTPSTGTIGNILMATSGGCKFSDVIEYSDFGEDIDNCPKNTMEMKRATGREIKISGTALTVTPAIVKMLIAAADVDGTDITKVVPRNDIDANDFDDLWWVGDYSDKNGETNGGFIAIHLSNALSTGGFSMETGENNKGKFPFETTAHYSIDDIDTVPYELYVQAGTSEPTSGSGGSGGSGSGD